MSRLRESSPKGHCMNTSEPELKSLFTAIENSVVAEGKTLVPEVREVIDRVCADARMDESDDDLFHKLVLVVFYSGFRAATVTAKREVILRHLGDWRRAKDFGPAEVSAVLADQEMIANRAKVEACVHNAKQVALLSERHGSFAGYLKSFPLEELREELKDTFKFLGKVTVYHFMTDTGFDVLKPDRVVMRVFHRLGLVEDLDRHEEAIEVGRKIAAAAGVPIRRVDRVVVAFGQVETKEFGLAHGICLETKPRCMACGVSARCHQHQNLAAPLGA